MAHNLAIQKIAEQYIRDLTAQELNDLLEKTRGHTADINPLEDKSIREVKLPNIQAESEWIEMMEIFRQTYPLTEIYQL